MLVEILDEERKEKPSLSCMIRREGTAPHCFGSRRRWLINYCNLEDGIASKERHAKDDNVVGHRAPDVEDIGRR